MAGYYTGSTTTATTTSYYTNESVWREWVVVSGSSTQTTAASTDPVWSTWTSTASTTASTTYTTEDTWYMWVNTSTGERVFRGHGDIRVPVREVVQETPEQIAARREETRRSQERWRLEQAERERKRKEAEERATELLLDNLTDAQRSDMKRDGFFFVNSKREGRKYRIRKGRVGNVDVIQDDRIIHRLCAHPNVNCPDDDTRLAQKLMLEHMEDAFIGRANVHPARH